MQSAPLPLGALTVTRREQQVLRPLGNGYNTCEVAKTLERVRKWLDPTSKTRKPGSERTVDCWPWCQVMRLNLIA